MKEKICYIYMYYINIFIRIPEGEGNGAKTIIFEEKFLKLIKGPQIKEALQTPSKINMKNHHT